MPGAATSPRGRRKVRCPKCTALLSEPASSIFECPICSTLLLAKATPGDSNNGFWESLPNENDKEAESTQHTKEGESKLGKATKGNDEPSQTQGKHQPMDYERKEGTSINGNGRSQEQPMVHVREEGASPVENYREQEQQPMNDVRNESTSVSESDGTRGQQSADYARIESIAIDGNDGMLGLQEPVEYVYKEGISINENGKTRGEPPMDYVNKQATLISGDDRTIRQLPMDFATNEGTSIVRKEDSLITDEDEGPEGQDHEERDSLVDGNSWTLQSQILRDTQYDLSFKYSLEGVSSLESDDQPLYRKRSHRPKTVPAETCMPKIDASDMRLYIPLRIRLSHSRGESSDQSEHESFESASHDGSESDFDFPAPLSEGLQAIKLPDSFSKTEYPDSDCVVSATPNQLEMDHDVIDHGESTLQEPSGHIEGPQLEIPSQIGDAGKIASDVKRGPDLGEEDAVKKEPVLPTGLDEAKVTITEFGHRQSDNRPELPDVSNPICSMVSEGDNRNLDVVGSNEMMPLDSSRQQLHGADVGGVFAGGEEKEADRNQGTVSLQVKESKPEPDADIWKEVSESLGMSPSDGGQSLKLSGLCNVKEERMNADILNSCMEASMSSLSGSGEDATVLTFQEDTKLKQSVQNLAFSDPDNTSSSDGTLNIANTSQPKIALQTSDLQKFLQNASDLSHLHDNMMLPEASSRKDARVRDCQPGSLLSSVGKIEQSNAGRLVPDVRNMSTTNVHLSSPIKVQDIERKFGSSSWSEKVATNRYLLVKKDLHSREKFHSDPREELDTAVLQESAVTEQHTSTDNSAVNMLESRMYHERTGPPERLQLYDREGKLHDRVIPQVQRSRNSEGLYMAGSDRNTKGSSATQERFVQPASGLVDWQGHNTLLQNQSCQADLHVLEQSPGRFSHHPVNNFCGFSGASSQPYAYTNHHCVSNPFGLAVSSANRSYPYQVPSHPSMLPVAMQDHAFTHYGYHPVSPVCILCLHHQHSHVPQPQMPHCALCFSQSGSMAHQPGHGECWNCHQAHHVQASAYASSLVGCSQTCISSKLAQRHDTSNVELKSQDSSVRKHTNYPPLPQGGGAPYVICKNCSRILQVPTYLLPNDGMTQKLRCSGCGKVSKFSVYHDIQQTCIASLQSPAVTSMVGASSMSPLVQSSKHGRQLSVSKVTQSMESSYNEGLVSVSAGLHLPYEQGLNKILLQTDGIAATIFTTGTLNHNSQGGGLSKSQSRYCETDTSLNSCGESNPSSSSSTTCPSSPFENAYGLCVDESQKAEALRVGKLGFEGSKMSNGVRLQSMVDEQEEGLDFGAPRISDGDSLDHSESRMRSPENKQDYHRENYGDVSGNEPLRGHQPAWTIESCQQLVLASTENGTDKEKKLGPPLIVLFNQESKKSSTSPKQRVSFEDSRSAVWSPASGSPLYDHPIYERSYEREQDISQSHSPSAQHFVSRGPRYIAGLLRRSLRDFGRGGQ